jgi:hypothetical protein
MLDVGLRLSSTNVDAGCGCHPTGLFMMTHSPSVPYDSVWLRPVCMLDEKRPLLISGSRALERGRVSMGLKQGFRRGCLGSQEACMPKGNREGVFSLNMQHLQQLVPVFLRRAHDRLMSCSRWRISRPGQDGRRSAMPRNPWAWKAYPARRRRSQTALLRRLPFTYSVRRNAIN